MRLFKLTAVISSIMLLTSIGYGAKKAVFIHGFGSDTTAWTDRETPQELVLLQVIDEAIPFGYDLDDPAYNNMDPVNILVNIISSLETKMSNHNQYGDEWFLVAHSMGGLIARAAEDYLNSQGNLNIVGILTIGAPHQGAPAANVQENNAQAIADAFLNVTNEGPNAGTHWVADVSLIDDAIAYIVTGAITPDLAADIGLGTVLEFARQEAEYWVNYAGETNANEIIGHNGLLINHINNNPLPAIPYKSIVGSEKSPTLIRWASELNTFYSDQYNEEQVLEVYSSIKDWYHLNQHWWNNSAAFASFRCNVCEWATLTFGSCHYCNDAANYYSKRDKWRNGKAAWETIDTYWGNIINSAVPFTQTGTRMVPVGCEGLEPWQYWSCISNNPDGFYWIEETYTYIVWVPAKNDGLLPPEMNVWSNSQILDDEHNPYYRDTDFNGGWNHSEMIRYTRIYDGEDDGTIGENIITPLKDNVDWVESNFSD